MNDAPGLTTYKVFRGDYIEPTPPGQLDTCNIPVYLAAEVEALLKETRAALTTFRTARTEAQFSLAMLQADSLLARLR